uniref:M23 family metallopeptidase n=1 Tax=Lachnoclostridium phocaeense TaxID=1871021 RepID=UPI0026DD7AEE|nr:M23 family metallopeptidase [Lachnoclostridium phocaeense]
MRKIDWKKGTGSMLFGTAVLMIALVIALMFIQLFIVRQQTLSQQAASDAIADGTAVYMSNEGRTYDDAYGRAMEIKDLITEETGTTVGNMSIDRQALEDENTVTVDVEQEYPYIMHVREDNAYTVRIGASTVFTGGSTGDLINPCPSGTVTSEFGGRQSPGGIGSTDHRGRDYGAPIGADILAADGGRVTRVSASAARGNFLVIDHGNGMETLYQHCSQILVTQGQTVNQGDVIAKVGNTGNSTGPHLHFEVHINGTPVDPREYLEE